jgi:heavy metal sensor kinase
MRFPIRVRMTVWYAGLLAVIIVGVGAFLLLQLRSDLFATMDGRLNPALDQIALGYHEEGPAEAHDVSVTVLSGESPVSQVLTPARRVTSHYGDPVSARPIIGARDIPSLLAGGRLEHTMTLRGRRFRIVARRTTRGSHPRIVIAGESTGPIDRSVHRLLTLLVLACPVAIAATAAGGWWLARRSLRPISRLTTDAGEIGIDRLADRLPVPAAGDEVARLATTLNTMLERIQAGVEEQHRLVADASHELRSPLAAMRAELEVSLRADELDARAQAVLRSTLEEVERLSRTVEALLTLAQADQGRLHLRLADVDLADVARATAVRLRALATSRDVRLVAQLSPAPARGDAARLEQAVGNLLDNAVKYSPGDADVTVTTGVAGEEAFVRVRDHGPGIPQGARESVFDRFQRLDASRARATGGSGIGLSIVREIARAHGGRAWTEPAPGGGSSFVLAVPLAAGRRPSHGVTRPRPRDPVSGTGAPRSTDRPRARSGR